MARVLGLGGVFFRSPDPAALAAWYRDNLGLELAGGSEDRAWFDPSSMPSGGKTEWRPFPAETNYFAPSRKSLMLSLLVDDVEGALTQVKAAGAMQIGGVESSERGQYGWFMDPDGNKVELWQPK